MPLWQVASASQARICREQLRTAVEADWEYAFIVCATDDEHIVVRFEMSTLDSEPGLVAYMNLFARTNHVVSKFLLKKARELLPSPRARARV